MVTSGVVSFAPARVDLLGVRAGDRNVMSFAVTKAGVPVDLTGAHVSAQARAKPSSQQIQVSAVVTVDDGTGGTGVLRWPGEAVRDTFPPGVETWKGVWDFQVLWPSDPEPETLIEGVIEFRMDVTRVPAP
jgi:hypothetical protein